MIFLIAPRAVLGDEFVPPEFSLHGLADLRYQHLDAQPGWVDEGLGKFRYGGDVDRARLNEAAVTAHARWWDWAATVTLRYGP